MSEEEALRVALFNLERTLTQVQDKLRNAHVLNGGFDLLMEKIAKIEDVQDKILDDVNDLKKTMYDPDDGLFSRIKTTDDASSERVHTLDKTVAELKTRLEDDVEDIEKLDNRVEAIESLTDQVEDLTKWKSNITKLIWAVVVPIATTFVKVLYDFFVAHVQLK